MNNTNNYSARESFRIAKGLLYNAMRDKFDTDEACWNWVNSRKLSQSEIRLEVGLNTVNNSFTFGMTPNQANSSNTIFPTEQRLNLQDSLITSEYGIYVGAPASATDVNFALCTYGNTQIFSTAGAAAAIDNTFYSNGYYQLKCNNDVLIPYRGLFNHLYRGQTQQTDALGVGSPKDQLRGAEDGQITQEPNLLLIGSKNYQPSIELKNALPAIQANSRAIIIYKGVLAQNSTIVN